MKCRDEREEGGHTAGMSGGRFYVGCRDQQSDVHVHMPVRMLCGRRQNGCSPLFDASYYSQHELSRSSIHSLSHCEKDLQGPGSITSIHLHRRSFSAAFFDPSEMKKRKAKQGGN